jgi:hypothetical protein
MQKIKHINKNSKSVRRQDWVRLSTVGNLRPAELVRRLSYATTKTIAATTAGYNFSPTDVRASSTEWSSIAALYSQYRVLAIRLNFIGDNINYTATNSPHVQYLLCGTDRSGSTSAGASANAVWALDQPKVFNIQTVTPVPITYEAKAIDLEDQNYVASSSNQTSFSIPVWLSTNWASGSISLFVFVEAMVEFKGAL